MQVTVLYFASLREALGCERETLSLPVSVTTAGALREFLAARDGQHGEALAPGRALRMAVDKKLARPDSALHEGAEVAFFPPVTGG